MTFIEPQLAESHTNRTPLVYDENWYAEPKWDGIRIGLRITQDGEPMAWSRLGNRKTMPPQIAEAAARLPIGYYDGELALVGGRSWDVTASKNSGQLALVLFDMMEVVGYNICPMSQDERRKYLVTATEGLVLPGIYVAEPFLDFSEFQSYYDGIVGDGGEGIMLKRHDAPYRPGMRSQAWVKVKQNIEVRLVCAGFEEGTTKGLLSVARLTLPNGTETTVKSRTMKDAQEWTAKPSAYIGRTMEVEAQCWTPSGSLRHPRMVRWGGPHE